MNGDRFRTALMTSLKRFGVILSLAALLAITVGSLLPREHAGDMGGSDKLLHFVAYAIAILPVTQLKMPAQVIFAVGVLMWSGGIELVQPSVGRSASLMDLVANAAGLLIGLALGVVLDRILFKTGSKPA